MDNMDTGSNQNEKESQLHLVLLLVVEWDELRLFDGCLLQIKGEEQLRELPLPCICIKQ